MKQKPCQEFDLTDLGPVPKYLGVEFKNTPEGLFLTQNQYAMDMIKDFGVENSKIEHIPLLASLILTSDMNSDLIDSHDYCRKVGKLIFLTTTRPDLAFAVSCFSRFMGKPQKSHLEAVHHIFCYINKPANFGLLYKSGQDYNIHDFEDADWASCPETRRSTGGYCFMMLGATITWQSKRQQTIARSYTESEYTRLSTGTSEGVWLNKLLQETGVLTKLPPLTLTTTSTDIQKTVESPALTIKCDNQSAIKLAKNLVFHARTKHIETHHHFIKEKVESGQIKLDYVRTDSQPPGILQ